MGKMSEVGFVGLRDGLSELGFVGLRDYWMDSNGIEFRFDMEC
jgi:hypothetical protein